MAQDEQGKWSYAVALGVDDEVWCFEEDELDSIGRMAEREDFYDETSIRVVVAPVTGHGSIKHGPDGD